MHGSLYLVAGVAALLALLRSPFQLVVALLAASALAVHPEFRAVADSLLGTAAPRSSAPFDDSDVQRKPRTEHNNVTERAGEIIELNVPSIVVKPLDKLLSLVIRDFVAWWYTANISLGDDRFLRESRSSLNAFVNAFSARLGAMDTTEASTYMTSACTTALIREMRDQKDEEKLEEAERDRQLEEEKARIVKRTRIACEELLFTFAPRSAVSSPAVSALLAEILTCQLHNIIMSLDSDWLNQTLISYLEAAPALIAETESREAHFSPVVPSVTSPLDTLQFEAPSPHIPSSVEDVTPRAALSMFLERPYELDRDLLASLREGVHNEEAGKLSAKEELVLTTLTNEDDATAEAFHEYIDGLNEELANRAQTLLRLLGHLHSFDRLVRLSQLAPETMRQDCLSVLARTMRTLDGLREGPAPKDLDDVLAMSLLETSVHPLRNWIVKQIEGDLWPSFAATRQSRGPAALSVVPEGSWMDAMSDTVASTLEPLVAPIERAANGYDVPDGPLQFSVSVTDLSLPSTYDSRGLVRLKRELEYLIAVEVVGQPGFIITRRQADLERLDSELSRLLSPRTLLPSVTQKTSVVICRELEIYLETLLRDARYAALPPVQTFFERERTAGGSAGPGLNLLDLAEGGFRSIRKAGDFATKGLTSVVSAPLQLLPTSSSSPARAGTSTAPLAGELKYTPRKKTSFGMLRGTPSRKGSTQSVTSPTKIEAPKEEEEVVEAPVKPASLPATPTRAEPTPTLSASTPAPLSIAAKAASFDPRDLDRIIGSAMALLESAYDLVEGQWSLRRGLMRVMETIVRSTSTGSLEVALASMIATADADTVARKLTELTDSFWPKGTWHSSSSTASSPARTPDEKAATAAKARALLLDMAPDGLKMTLGSGATAEAFGRLHAALAGPTSFRVVSSVMLDCIRLLLL